jgi:hypothetical protein
MSLNNRQPHKNIYERLSDQMRGDEGYVNSNNLLKRSRGLAAFIWYRNKAASSQTLKKNVKPNTIHLNYQRKQHAV